MGLNKLHMVYRDWHAVAGIAGSRRGIMDPGVGDGQSQNYDDSGTDVAGPDGLGVFANR